MATPIAPGSGYRPAGYRRVDRVASQDFSIAFRVVAAVAATVLLLFGLIGLARIDWGNGGIDAAAVEVADVTFTPVMAIATAGAGLLALIAAATRDRATKIVVGALLIAVGVVAFVARPDSDRVILEDAHGWLAVIVGAVLVLAALAMSWGGRRVVESEAVYDDTRAI
jgi:hypothetical protein